MIVCTGLHFTMGILYVTRSGFLSLINMYFPIIYNIIKRRSDVRKCNFTLHPTLKAICTINKSLFCKDKIVKR
ncbi:hypothetical protein HanHA89_Chr08g0285761 [Helianthus annuus]|nr:hypothetical protein HanHA89_Chr08g0285761 [Helianthus annuus]